MINIKDKYKKEMVSLLGEGEAEKYFNALNEPFTRGLAVNTTKIGVDEFLKNNEMEIEPLKFDDGCFKYLGKDKVGASTLYKAGAFYMQEPSAMVPGLVLPIKSGDKVLDVCASPGGKTFQIAKRLDGVLVSNEIDFKRAKVLGENVERLGLKNVIVSTFSTAQLREKYEGVFDAILVDAPCSGEGMFRREEQAVTQWSKDYVLTCSKMQKEILSDVTKCLKVGGYLVYSTCTFSINENEENVKFLVDNGFEILPIDEKFGGVSGIKIEGYDTQLSKRFYPQNGVGEGQFVCLLKKVRGEENMVYKKQIDDGLKKDKVLSAKFFEDNFVANFYDEIKDGLIKKNDSIFFCSDKRLIVDEKRVLSYGVKLGVITKNRFEPSFNLFTAFGGKCKINFEVSKKEAEEYFLGNTLSKNSDKKGWCAVSFCGITLGGGKIVDGIIKNHYPKGLRN